MKNMLPPFLEKLDKERQRVFWALKEFSPEFVLAGGTALLLQMGHRLSLDFDCFSEKEIKKVLIRKARRVFGGKIFVEVGTSEQLTFLTKEKIKVTFSTHPFKPLKKSVKTESIALFHLDDLAANKAYTIGRRAAWRDYVDLFFILKWEINSLEKIIADAEKKFNGEFNGKLFLRQLVYFDDLNILPVKFLKKTYTEKEIQNFLRSEVKKYIKKILK